MLSGDTPEVDGLGPRADVAKNRALGAEDPPDPSPWQRQVGPVAPVALYSVDEEVAQDDISVGMTA